MTEKRAATAPTSTPVVLSPDKNFQRTWDKVPQLMWSCRTCWALVAHHDLSAHTKVHADDKKRAGFGA